MTQTVYKHFGVEIKKYSDSPDGSSYVRGYFTSDAKDEVGDIITRQATEQAIPSYRKWGNIRYMHLPRPVAKVKRIGSQDGLEWNEVEIDVIDPQTKFEVENGLLSALSVGILINFDDIEFMDDGGMKINAYKLTEISLVDHPANYDASLKTLPIQENIRQMVRQYGLDAFAGNVKNFIDTEMQNMETEVTEVNPESEVIKNAETETVENTESEIVEPEIENEKDAQDNTESISGQEDEQEIDDVQKFLAEYSEFFVGFTKQLNEVVVSLREVTDTLMASVKTMQSEDTNILEDVTTEVSEAEEQVGDTKDLSSDEEVGQPANRIGMVLSSDGNGEVGENPNPVTGLRQSLQEYLTRRIK